MVVTFPAEMEENRKSHKW